MASRSKFLRLRHAVFCDGLVPHPAARQPGRARPGKYTDAFHAAPRPPVERSWNRRQSPQGQDEIRHPPDPAKVKDGRPPINLPTVKPIAYNADRDAEIARVVGELLLEQRHYLQQPISPEMSQRWLKNYMDSLDVFHALLPPERRRRVHRQVRQQPRRSASPRQQRGSPHRARLRNLQPLHAAHGRAT